MKTLINIKNRIEEKGNKKVKHIKECGRFYLITVESVKEPDAIVQPLIYDSEKDKIKIMNPLLLSKEESKAIKQGGKLYTF